LPQEIGIHFDGNGHYDLIGPKQHIFSYYPIGLIAVVVCELFQHLSSALQIRGNLSDDGKNTMRIIATSFIGLIELDICAFIAIVGSTIATQSSLNTTLPVCCAFVLILGIIAVLIATIYTTFRFKKSPNEFN
jgi:hypothetical protein